MSPLLHPSTHTSDGDEDGIHTVATSDGDEDYVDCFVSVCSVDGSWVCLEGSPTSAGAVLSSCREEVGQLCFVSRCCVEDGVWNSGEDRGRTLSRDGRDPDLRAQIRDGQRSVCDRSSTRGVGNDPWFIGGWPLGGNITVPVQLCWRRGFSVPRVLNCSDEENEEQSELCELLCCGEAEDSVCICVPVCNVVPGVVMGLTSCGQVALWTRCLQPVCAIISQWGERSELCPDVNCAENGGGHPEYLAEESWVTSCHVERSWATLVESPCGQRWMFLAVFRVY